MTLKEKGIAFSRSVSAVCLFDLSPPFHLSVLFGCLASWIVEYCIRIPPISNNVRNDTPFTLVAKYHLGLDLSSGKLSLTQIQLNVDKFEKLINFKILVF